MIRFFVILINAILVLFLEDYFPKNVYMAVNVPQVVEGGSEFRVQVTLNKGELTSFSRFQQVLPAGLTAVEVNSANAVDFSFEENRLRIIWLKLPEQEQITFSYRVRVDERLKGEFDLAGTFSFIDNNQRRTIDLTPEHITITPNPTIDPALIVDLSEFEKIAIPDLLPKDKPNIACIRQKPIIDSYQNEILVKILVNKRDLQHHAKIEEQVPYGYNAVGVDARNGLFSFQNGVARFIWMDLPAEEHFVVSYKLIPNEGTIAGDVAITGLFSYIEGDRTTSLNLVEKDFDADNISAPELASLIQGIPKDLLKSSATYASAAPIADVNQPETSAEEAKPTREKTIRKPAKQEVRLASAASLEPENGVYYRIQLAAGHKPVKVKRYFKKYGFDADVKSEHHDGWYKYSVGSFKMYRDARDYRVHIWNTTDIKDAFVAAYNNGSRITVQEALMVANQKWYK